ncbi:MAG: peptidoglycan recognition family protein [Candidatus Choladocola sp.]|nr:peptidoglycan recognition family protein [Candidatus Choladocola sp.]
MRKDRKNGRKRIRWSHILIWFLAVLLTVAAVWLLLKLIPRDDIDVDSLIDETSTIKIMTETETEKRKNAVPCPEIDEQLLTINDYSRPGTKTDAIEKVVIHYLGNPKTTAQQNHDYFESLKDLKDVSMSANFVIGIEGEIIECVPPGEIAYASNSMNHLSISIENCHLDSTGRFTEATYESCVHLTAYLVEEYGLERDDIIRHYDVTGKECPLYYVEHEDKWEEFKDDVMNYIEECRKAAKK